jgi:hypothetical protein
MNHLTFNKKVRRITLLLAIPFQVNLQASDGNTGDNSRQPPSQELAFRESAPEHLRRPDNISRDIAQLVSQEVALSDANMEQLPPPVAPSRQRRISPVFEVRSQNLTPKEKQIAELAKCQFYQLKGSRRASIELFAIANINQQIETGAARDEPLVVDYDELVETAGRFSRTLDEKVDGNLVQQIAQDIGKSVLYVEVGNRAAGFGPQDIALRAIFARPDRPKAVEQSSWIHDHQVLDMINGYGPGAVVICHNSYLQRTVFSMPIDRNRIVTGGNDFEQLWNQGRNTREEIRHIGHDRTSRNGIFTAAAIAALAAVGYWQWPALESLMDSAISNLPSIKRISNIAWRMRANMWANGSGRH